ncbi:MULTISPECIES: CgeB family protein [Paenibacillus]|uniref:CgeB family protein n=1 Tax=Paenibacillus TaxID=44249 RepID=UPI0022B8D628|nr:glycosyltransferase [Paenibacillus caseinilyticus]MCZ8519165.1 glycosyltransferase [Paenibacillus caseinilyticus]
MWRKRIGLLHCGMATIDHGVTAGLMNIAKEVYVFADASELERFVAAYPLDLVLVLDRQEEALLKAMLALRERGIPTAVWFFDSPYRIDLDIQIAPHFEYVFTVDSSCPPVLQRHGCARSYYMPLAAGRNLFYPQAVSERYRSDILFIGTAYSVRLEIVDEMAPYLAGKKTAISGWGWDRLKQYGLLASSIRQDTLRIPSWLSPGETNAYYNGAAVCLNFHRSTEHEPLNAARVPPLSINNRIFEMSACGAFVMTDWRSDLPRSYVPGKEIETFSSTDELKEKLDYYLEHEEHRRRIALAGMQRTLRFHTYEVRLSELLQVVFEGRAE